MSGGWVAATTRGLALRRRLLGVQGARAVAAAGSWPEAVSQLAPTVYGRELSADADRAGARRAAAAATSWQLRVLAGWMPPGAGGLARLFAAPMEIANIEHHLSRLRGGPPGEPLHLGSLSVAWPRVAGCTTVEQVQRVLASSVWGDPGGADPVSTAIGLRVAWARRVATQVPEAVRWALGYLALTVARERFAFGRELAAVTAVEVDRRLGRRWRSAASIAELQDRVSPAASWVLTGVATASDLWRAEAAFVESVGSDADRLLARHRSDRASVTALLALLLVDLWRVRAAVEAAARGPVALEVFDAVA